MSTAEVIFEKAKRLPENLQAETLPFVDFLLSRRAAEAEDAEWSQFSAAQRAARYAAADAIYDND